MHAISLCSAPEWQLHCIDVRYPSHDSILSRNKIAFALFLLPPSLARETFVVCEKRLRVLDMMPTPFTILTSLPRNYSCKLTFIILHSKCTSRTYGLDVWDHCGAMAQISIHFIFLSSKIRFLSSSVSLQQLNIFLYAFTRNGRLLLLPPSCTGISAWHPIGRTLIGSCCRLGPFFFITCNRPLFSSPLN